MKIVALKSNFKEGIQAVERLCGSGQKLPILSHILIRAAKNVITLTGTNLEVATTATTPGKVIEDGVAAVPAGLLSGIVQNLQAERLNFESKEGNALEVVSDNYRATLRGLPAEDFPIIPEIKSPEGELKIKSGILREALSQVVAAQQPTEFHPELQSVLFHMSPDVLKLASTDSFRLAEKTISSGHFSLSSGEEARVLVPAKTVQELLRLMKGDDEVLIQRGENQILFKTAAWSLISRLLEGSFPEYSGIIPRKFETECAVGREDLMQAVKLVGILGGEGNEVSFSFDDKKKALEIFSRHQTAGENTYLLPAKIRGRSQSLVFNARYLLDALRVMPQDEVYVGCNSESDPALIKATADESYLYIVKPILKG